MSAMRRSLLLFLGLSGAMIALWALQPRAGHLTIVDARAQFLTGGDGSVRVFLTVVNEGPPDALVSVKGPGGTMAVFRQPDGFERIPIPSEGKAILAADGAHLGFEEGDLSLDEGEVIALTLEFEMAGEVQARAVFAAPIEAGEASDVGLFGIGGICRVGVDEPAPDVSITVRPADSGIGWLVQVNAVDFVFAQPGAELGHIPGYGHGHLYLDGVKLSRLYSNEMKIGEVLPGRHVLSVSLNTIDHRTYVVDSTPVVSSVEFFAP